MSNSQRIGLYLTDDNIVLAEAASKKPQKVVSSAITPSSDLSKEASFHVDANQEVQITSVFQRLLRENKIEAGPVYVSIPIRDVFLRSFVVPLMPTSELNNVVYYEAKKYVPFDLKLLDFVYEVIPFTENKQKKLRIVFYAIRKQTIEKYDRIFKQSGCKAAVYEPSLVSLAKYLVSKNQLRLDQKTVVIYTYENYGQIIFYEKGISYFVREFPLSVTEVHDAKAVPDVLRANLLREIRKSFAYYSRQFSSEKIKEVLVLTVTPDQELVKILVDELSVKVRVAEPSVTAGLQTIVGMDMMCACGSCITKIPSTLASFNFLQAKSAPQPSVSSGKNFFAQFTPLLAWNLGDFLYAIQAAVVCTLLLGGGFMYGQMNLQKIKKQNEGMAQFQGEAVSKSIVELDAAINRNKSQIDVYKKVLQDKSNMALMLIDLTKALPEGAWLENISMRYSSNHATMELTGYVYSPDEGVQFKSVNEFLSRLRNDAYFASIKLKLNTIQKKKIDTQEVVYFSITGS